MRQFARLSLLATLVFLAASSTSEDWSMPEPSSPSCYAPRCSGTWRSARHSTASRMPTSNVSLAPPKQLWSRRFRHPNRPYFSDWNDYNCSPPQVSACSLAGCSSPSPINAECNSCAPTKHPSAYAHRYLIDTHAEVINYLGTGTALLILATRMVFAAYDALAIRPHLALIRDALAHATPEDSSSPQTIR
ncbi:hypothetical protein [uncultured Xanthomonas sp.]|uniref:hypothetical protein n=1 Tax=uncultured Xanthomonas sp. TaxID=152831 RepID=UPI0025FD95D4|nr:hypothetical protein [uncultured Xanthomonas sp.]